jgi:hypothetical protein
MNYPDPPVEEDGPAGGLDCAECGALYEQRVLVFWTVDEVTTTFDCPNCHYTNELPMARSDYEFEG